MLAEVPLRIADCCNAKRGDAVLVYRTIYELCPLVDGGADEDGTETTIMNVQLVSPAALIATLTSPQGGGGHDEGTWRKLRARVGEELRYRRALRELRRLDDRDLDDINVARVDFPELARRHARGAGQA